MSRFYGTVQGNRGQGTRGGSRDIDTQAASWHGSIHVQVAGGAGREEQRIHIAARPWHGSGPDGTIFSGTWDELAKVLAYAQRLDPFEHAFFRAKIFQQEERT